MGKVMATTDVFVRPWLRGNVGGCIGLLMLADEWQMSFHALANKSYVVRNKAGEMQLAFESQLIHALIERRAPLQRRLRPEWSGEGPTRKCKITGYVIGEPEPLEWESPEIGKIKVKNSPEWEANPDKQLFYHASRDWARIYMPDVISGVYGRDEFDGAEVQRTDALEGSKGVLEKIAAARAEQADTSDHTGFDEQGIAKALDTGRHDHSEQQPGKEVAQEPAKEKAPSKPRSAKKQAPSEAKPKAAVPKDPQNEADYVAYAEDWIGKIKTPEQADDGEARWDGERELRATPCKVTIATRKRLEKLLQAACKKARGQDDGESES
jgi:hypothetical protein